VERSDDERDDQKTFFGMRGIPGARSSTTLQVLRLEQISNDRAFILYCLALSQCPILKNPKSR
jgi:hypothetical protein